MKNPTNSLVHSRWNGFSIILSLFVFAALPLTALGQDTGSVSGTVTNADNGNYMPGASVQLEGTSIRGFTNHQGQYRLVQVPAGSYTLNVSYLGWDDASVPVTVSAGVTTEQNVALGSDVVVLEEFIIESIVAGQARSINQQRMSDTITNVIASDAIGRLPDATVGEALMRLPGIGVDKDRGEPQDITIRGTLPEWNSITLNGERIPSVGSLTGGRDRRRVRLDAVPADLISEIEVTKAVTPDMDADAIGGNVNLKTKSPTELTERILSGKIQYGYNDFVDSNAYGFNVTYGDRYGPEKKLGLVLGANFNFTNNGVFNPIIEYDTVDELVDPDT